ncbi:hypothetical protein GQ457_03G024730 [Hibiscus cannabinus]
MLHRMVKMGLRYWDLTGIPCSHSICVILFNYEPLERYVDEAYRKENYQSFYHYALPTIPSEAFWKDTEMGPLEPPVKRKLPGRPKQKRKIDEGETIKGFNLSKRGSKCTCRCCGSQQTHDSTSLQPATTNVSQPPARNPSQPATTDVSQPPASNPSQPATGQASQPQFPNSRNTSTKTKDKASCGRQSTKPSLGPRGRKIMKGIRLYRNEKTGIQILNVSRSS